MVVNNSSDSHEQEMKSFGGKKAKEREMLPGEVGLSWVYEGGRTGGKQGLPQGSSWEDSIQACAREDGGCGEGILWK